PRRPHVLRLDRHHRRGRLRRAQGDQPPGAPGAPPRRGKASSIRELTPDRLARPMSIERRLDRCRGKGGRMATYLLLLGGADVDKRSGNAEIAPEMYERFARWLDGLKKNGHYVTSHKLRDQTGARLTVRGGQVVEGPFMETKEAVGGIFVIEAESLEAAVACARDCPTLMLQNGYVEVRVVDEVRHPVIEAAALESAFREARGR